MSNNHLPSAEDLRNYADKAVEQAEKLYTTVRNDERVGKYVATAETMATTLAETVNERIIQPVLAATGLRDSQRPKGGDGPSAHA